MYDVMFCCNRAQRYCCSCLNNTYSIMQSMFAIQPIQCEICHVLPAVTKLVVVQHSTGPRYSWHHKSAYTHLQFCGFEHCCASPTDPWASVIMPLGIAHQSLQLQLLRFLQTLARFKFPAKRSTSYWQKADAVSSQSHQELAAKLSQFFLHRQCNVLGEPLQVVAPKTKVC